MGVIAEHFYDDKGLVWPDQIAPAEVYLIAIGDEAVNKLADELYYILTGRGVAVIYDDRDIRPGEKFADADLMGIPMRVVVNSKSVTDNQYEIKRRNESSPEYLQKEVLIQLLPGDTHNK